jgi:hypothetical protein
MLHKLESWQSRARTSASLPSSHPYREAQPQKSALVEVRAERINQLFDTLDPTPYPQKDLAQATEDFIVGWARELHRSQPIKIILYLPTREAESPAAKQLRDAFSNYFQYRSNCFRLGRKELFRIGRWSLLIGLSVLASCVTVGQMITGWFETSYLNRAFNEGLIILGWVANWRPLEIFLYEWLPIARQEKLYRRLSKAHIEIRAYMVEPVAI